MNADAPFADTVLYELHGRVALITFNRPESRNAWTVPMLRVLIDAVQRANASADVGAIVLTGAGSAYSAGIDFKAPPEPKEANGRSTTLATLTMGKDEHNWLKLLQSSKPVIAAINGPAIGLGVTHALSADIRIAAESATFAFPFLRLGAMPECGCTALLTRLVGFGRAMELCLTAGQVDAAEALRIGLVTAVHPDGHLREAALAMAERIASFPALQVKLSKQLMWENAGEYDPDALMRRESLAYVEMLRARGRKSAF